MDVANIHEAKTHLSKLIKKVQEGEEVTIAKAGTPVAKLVSYTQDKTAITPGVLKDKIFVADDFTDESEEIEKLFYGT